MSVYLPRSRLSSICGMYHVSFGNKNPASGYKLQIFDKGQIMKGSSGNITAVNLHGIEDADRSNLSESGRCPFNFTQESFVGIILKLIGEAVLIVVSGFSAAFGVAETVKIMTMPSIGRCNLLLWIPIPE